MGAGGPGGPGMCTLPTQKGLYLVPITREPWEGFKEAI